MNAGLANFILSRQYGFIQDGDLPEIIKLDPLCWLLVRCGAQHGRFSAPAQNIGQLVSTIEAAGDWVRDVSFPSQCIDEARAFVVALPVGHLDPIASHTPSHCKQCGTAYMTHICGCKFCAHCWLDCPRCGGLRRDTLQTVDEIIAVHHQNRQDFNEAECGGVFDGFDVTSDADPGL